MSHRRNTRGHSERGVTDVALQFASVPFPALTNLRGRYRMDQVATSGSTITQMNDMSGFAQHLPAVNAPDLITGPNGQPAAQFVEGSTEYMSLAAWDWGAVPTAMTFAIVVRVDVATASRRWFNYASQGLIARHTAAGLAEFIETGVGGVTSTGTTDIRGAYDLVVFTLTPGTDQAIQVAGAVEDTDLNTLGAVAQTSTLTLGAGTAGAAPASISVAEFILMRAIITAPEYTALRAYTLSRYGIS